MKNSPEAILHSVAAKAFYGQISVSHIEPRYLDILGERSEVEIFDNGYIAKVGERSVSDTIKHASNVKCVVKGQPLVEEHTQPLRMSNIGSFLQEVDGRFCIAAADDNTLLLATDILGSSSIFYYQSKQDHLYFASHLGLLIDLLPSTPVEDELGVATILTGGCQVFGRTHFSGVSRLQAARYIVSKVESGALTVCEREYLDPITELFDPESPSEPSIQVFEELLVDSVERIVDSEEDVLTLSGGRDSRAIAYALALSGKKPLDTYTYGDWRSLDARGASDTASRLRINNYRLKYGDWRIQDFADQTNRLSRGMCGLQTGHNTVAFATIGKFKKGAVVGFLGDALTGAHLPQENENDKDVVFKYLSSFGQQFEDLIEPNIDLIYCEIEKLVGAMEPLTDVQRSIYIDLLIRQATLISGTIDLWDWHIPIKTPFFSRKFIKFCVGLPAQSLRAQSFYDSWLSSKRMTLETKHSSFLDYPPMHYMHHILDRFAWRTGYLKPKPLLNWKERINREKNFILSSADNCRNERLAALLSSQVRAGNRKWPLLLAAGLALSLKKHE